MMLIDFIKPFLPFSQENFEKLSSLTGTLRIDSRQVQPGDAFMVVCSSKDTQAHIAQARARGAVLILDSVPHPRKIWSQWSQLCFPDQPSCCVAVTGTNGKSSTVTFLRQLWHSAGRRAASIGTLGVTLGDNKSWEKLNKEALKSSHTSPDAFVLHHTLTHLARHNIDSVALEASSHGLDQERLAQVNFTAAAFTNLSHEHLDYHKTMEKYFEAKKRLFTELLPATATVVLNQEDPYGQQLGSLCQARGQKILWFGSTGKADIRLEQISLHAQGLQMKLSLKGISQTFNLPFIGAFQGQNILAACGLALSTGMTPAQIFQGLSTLQNVPGRMELIGKTSSGGRVIVDYSHKPLALKLALQAIRDHSVNTLVVVFGCGGDRDRAKRPMMGQIAAQYADRIIITDDNPRTEDPAAIRAAILSACPQALEIPDRFQAIEQAIKSLKEGDVCLIAGKGDEQGQIFGTEVHPFDDREVARFILKKGNKA